ncbi:tRNA preQ1(34) S-adenosylmethionine ribosyltransferase-isomerase QueA [Campylobacter sp. VBCF_05 NA6]|uniref:tRNA preQ1(34) S-adenosylmethionine ribosyltransferase-isomerase QueA n=1 Tax=unclassified Campylobacter TaxID=2593542 RepID=UPI0022E9E3C0|nr:MULTISPECIES: tRNA preQ1(34) S-adenosylmethionine ribosyltransferase-isomerase QueA [unclassified Campylobacter]MDA3057591.1 tRNA preQ1(34) S-adenosylmethionine ribosyltransferase-isomerase QueA [Campylobacter sp. VBCF_04 NA7]MDA3058492.1 tRNA preQ1(34) S-adenosylmethionine ribosyltransferase-isomerase QueA [Campylobacter sp. VBCF_05 NA6]
MDLNLVDSYDYYLPPNLIANAPLMPKESARLLVYEREKNKISHLKFGDLAEILPPCEIIFNDTKVIKARIFGAKSSGGKIELLLNSPLNDNKFSAYIRGRVSVGSELVFDKNLRARVVECCEDGLRVVEFSRDNHALGTHEIFALTDEIGHVPLPPYIKREDTKDDESWYQSIFAREAGAVAAPTASLHFSEEMLRALRANHGIYYITLHVGAGTFKPVEARDLREHKMHSEFYSIAQDTAEILKSDKKILGVGTTVTRTVENFARNGARSGACELFLHPNNPPIRQNYLLTNFHLPKSTLIMLVASFIGLEKTLEIYREAVEQKYRFYSYGDGMIIL